MEHPNRKQLRLSEYDYASNGAYFVTICTENRRKLLSVLRRGGPCGRPVLALTELGRIAKETLIDLEKRYPIVIDCFIIMPDHIHAIIWIDAVETTARVAPTLSQVIGAYKSLVLHRWRPICNQNALTMGKVWQRGFYEHVVRNRQDLDEIRSYINANPDRWAEKLG